MTTKILALTDALGNLVRFVLLPGHRFDTVGVAPLIQDLEFDALIADKAFDRGGEAWLRNDLAAVSAWPPWLLPSHSSLNLTVPAC
jgi:hypothetical protein